MNWARTCLQIHAAEKLLFSNSKGDVNLVPVNDEQGRRWARRLEWVIKEHLDHAEDDLDKLQADYEAVLRRYQEAHERRYDQAYISNLTKQLDAANKSLRQFHLYGHMQ